MKTHIVKKQITLKATPEQVWNALTNPEKTKRYFFRCRVYSNWQPGSSITFKGRLFFLIPIELSGTVLEVEPNKLLRYNLKNRKSNSTSTVTDELTYANGITTLSITDDVGQGEGAEKRYRRSEKGWDKVLRGLKEMLEKGR